MTSPHVTELPRKLEPSGRDTFVSAVVIEFAPAAARAEKQRKRAPEAPGPDGPPDAPPLSAA